MLLLFEVSKKERNISELAKKGDLTSSVASIVISRWAKEGLVLKKRSEERKGNDLIIVLTDYGKEQVKLLKQINQNYKKFKKGEFNEEAEEDPEPKEDVPVNEDAKEVDNGGTKN